MNIRARLEKLEQRAKPKVPLFDGIVHRIIAPEIRDCPMRYAESCGMRFSAGPDESEDQLLERVKSAIPKIDGRMWGVMMYPTRPDEWIMGAAIRNK